MLTTSNIYIDFLNISCINTHYINVLKMTHSINEDVPKASARSDATKSSGVSPVPFHFLVHKPGCHFESCCGICNLFPGVLLIGFIQVILLNQVNN